MLNTEQNGHQGNLLTESFGMGLLDSGCTKTVAGQVWINEFISSLSDTERKEIKECKSSSLFRFGDGVEIRSKKVITIPVVLGRQKFFLDVEVVVNDIPLLISKATMKKLQMKLDFTQDLARIGNEEVKLFCNSRGHYSLSVTKERIGEDGNVVLYIQSPENIDIKQKMSKSVKLHRQLSHASKDKLLKLVKNSGCNDKEFLRCVKQC